LRRRREIKERRKPGKEPGDKKEIIIPFEPEKLDKIYSQYIKEKGITDPEQKRRIYWAMFYAAKEQKPWRW